jgi:hypothetical protein
MRMVVRRRNDDDRTVAVSYDVVARAAEQRRSAVPRAMRTNHDERGIRSIGGPENSCDGASLEAFRTPPKLGSFTKCRAPRRLDDLFGLGLALGDGSRPGVERAHQPKGVHHDELDIKPLSEARSEDQAPLRLRRSIDTDDDWTSLVKI